MKIAVVYTSTTPELITEVERNLKNTITKPLEVSCYEDASILAEIREVGFVGAKPAARLVGLFAKAIEEGADVILNACSSVGEVADAMQNFAKYSGIPIVRIDEEMCCEAVRNDQRIAVMATLPTTLAPTKNTVLRVARELGKQVEVVEILVEEAFGLSEDEFKNRLLTSAKGVDQSVDCIVFAQGSMAYAEEFVAEQISAKVFSSPRFGAVAVAEALRKKRG